MSETITIGQRIVGRGHPCFVIAEAGVNHNGDAELAHKMIDAAKESGAHAVKFQHFVPEELVSSATPKAEYQAETTGEQGSMIDMVRPLRLSDDEHAQLKQHCDDAGVLYICTPYDFPSADALDHIDTPAYKVASTDTTNIPFLRHLASKGRPVIMSTGMCTMEETTDGVRTLADNGLDGKIAVLHCTTQYPAPFNELNLLVIQTFLKDFGIPVGYSDHTPGVGASPWAVALGACIIEKHFTLDRSMEGPDHRASMEPSELRELVAAIGNVEAALGDGVKRVTESEAANKSVMQKSLVAKRNIAAGSQIAADDLTCKRPATGLPPAMFDEIIGLTAASDIAEDSIITPEMIKRPAGTDD